MANLRHRVATHWIRALWSTPLYRHCLRHAQPQRTQSHSAAAQQRYTPANEQQQSDSTLFRSSMASHNASTTSSTPSTGFLLSSIQSMSLNSSNTIEALNFSRSLPERLKAIETVAKQLGNVTPATVSHTGQPPSEAELVAAHLASKLLEDALAVISAAARTSNNAAATFNENFDSRVLDAFVRYAVFDANRNNSEQRWVEVVHRCNSLLLQYLRKKNEACAYAQLQQRRQRQQQAANASSSSSKLATFSLPALRPEAAVNDIVPKHLNTTFARKRLLITAELCVELCESAMQSPVPTLNLMVLLHRISTATKQQSRKSADEVLSPLAPQVMTVTTLNAMMHRLLPYRSIEAVVAVYELMLEHSIKPDVGTYAALVTVFLRQHNEVKAAHSVLKAALDSGISKADGSTLVGIFVETALANADIPELEGGGSNTPTSAQKPFNPLNPLRDNNRPTSSAINTANTTRQVYWHAAYTVVSDCHLYGTVLNQHHIVPSSTAYSDFISHMVDRHKNSEMGYKVFELMMKHQLCLDKLVQFNRLHREVAMQLSVEKAHVMIDYMTHHPNAPWKLNAEPYVNMLDAAEKQAKITDPSYIDSVVQQMQQQQIELDEAVLRPICVKYGALSARLHAQGEHALAMVETQKAYQLYTGFKGYKSSNFLTDLFYACRHSTDLIFNLLNDRQTTRGRLEYNAFFQAMSAISIAEPQHLITVFNACVRVCRLHSAAAKTAAGSASAVELDAGNINVNRLLSADQPADSRIEQLDYLPQLNRELNIKSDAPNIYSDFALAALRLPTADARRVSAVFLDAMTHSGIQWTQSLCKKQAKRRVELDQLELVDDVMRHTLYSGASAAPATLDLLVGIMQQLAVTQRQQSQREENAGAPSLLVQFVQQYCQTAELIAQQLTAEAAMQGAQFSAAVDENNRPSTLSISLKRVLQALVHRSEVAPADERIECCVITIETLQRLGSRAKVSYTQPLQELLQQNPKAKHYAMASEALERWNSVGSAATVVKSVLLAMQQQKISQAAEWLQAYVQSASKPELPELVQVLIAIDSYVDREAKGSTFEQGTAPLVAKQHLAACAIMVELYCNACIRHSLPIDHLRVAKLLSNLRWFADFHVMSRLLTTLHQPSSSGLQWPVAAVRPWKLVEWVDYLSRLVVSPADNNERVYPADQQGKITLPAVCHVLNLITALLLNQLRTEPQQIRKLLRAVITLGTINQPTLNASRVLTSPVNTTKFDEVSAERLASAYQRLIVVLLQGVSPQSNKALLDLWLDAEQAVATARQEAQPAPRVVKGDPTIPRRVNQFFTLLQDAQATQAFAGGEEAFARVINQHFVQSEWRRWQSAATKAAATDTTETEQLKGDVDFVTSLALRCMRHPRYSQLQLPAEDAARMTTITDSWQAHTHKHSMSVLLMRQAAKCIEKTTATDPNPPAISRTSPNTLLTASNHLPRAPFKAKQHNKKYKHKGKPQQGHQSRNNQQVHAQARTNVAATSV